MSVSDLSVLSSKNTTTDATALRYQARREPQRGPGKHSRGTPKHCCGALLGRKIFNFSFQNGALWCIFVFLSDGGAPNVAGSGVADPLPHPLDGPVHYNLRVTTTCNQYSLKRIQLLQRFFSQGRLIAYNCTAGSSDRIIQPNNTIS